jgi:hypothetical protein
MTLAAQADRWIHVKVEETGEKAEKVRINIPLALAEKVLPAIKADKLCDGKVKLDEKHFHNVDLRALLEAIRTTGDNEFVTVESKQENVRVAKAGGYLIVQVLEGRDAAKKVDVKIPFTVVEAMLSGGQDELDVLAGLRALSAHGDVELVTVNEPKSTVRIWVDSRNTAE